jgi:prevent-host-death family protein
MPITTLTSRELNQDTSRAKRAAQSGPVIITDRGRPSHVLLSIEEYRRLTGAARNLVDLLAMRDDVGHIDFEPPRLAGRLAEPADLD